MIKTSEKIGVLVIILFFIFGFYCFVDVCRTLNIKNRVIGYFYTEPEIVTMSDFEFDIKSLLFINTGEENQYYAQAKAKPVSNFDSTKQYTITINGIEANRVEGNYTYIDCNFTNQFNSSLNEAKLIDTLNIKINFYKEGTKLLFITNGGTEAIQLWNSYIAKNGFLLKIEEYKLDTQIKYDKIPEYTINYYDLNNTLIESYTQTYKGNKHNITFSIRFDRYNV